MVSTVISCLLDKSIFGFYDVVKLFITGGILKTQEFNNIYHWFMVSEMNKELASQTREKSNRTKFEISIRTSAKQQLNSSRTTDIGKKCFCYDIFLKGELRTVFSNTYCLSQDQKYQNYFQIKNAIEVGYSQLLIRRGNQMHESRLQVDNICINSPDYYFKGARPCRYTNIYIL